jgi:hypothetical protein
MFAAGWLFSASHPIIGTLLVLTAVAAAVTARVITPAIVSSSDRLAETDVEPFEVRHVPDQRRRNIEPSQITIDAAQLERDEGQRTQISSLQRELAKLADRVNQLQDSVEAHKDDISALRPLKREVQSLRDELRHWEPPAATTLVESHDTIHTRPLAGASRDDIHAQLSGLATKCMSRGLTLRRATDEVPSGFVIDSIDGSEIPNAFLVRLPSSADGWVVPNTREWFAFRERGWFNVSGNDDVSARIINVRRFPRLGKGQRVIERGDIEVAL